MGNRNKRDLEKISKHLPKNTPIEVMVEAFDGKILINDLEIQQGNNILGQKTVRIVAQIRHNLKDLVCSLSKDQTK